MMRKKVIIFYSKTAGGHLRAAEAIAQKLRQFNDNLEIIMHEALDKTDLGFKINPSKAYGILSIPLLPLYNILYKLTNTSLGLRMLRRTIKLVWGRSFKKIIEYEKPDLIITTHHFISPSTIHSLQKKYPFVTVVTDLGPPHRIWFDKKSDRIITPTPELANLAKLLLSSNDDQVINLGFPLKEEFKPVPFRGFTNTILVIGGGTGAGNIEKQIKFLLNALPDKKFLVVCGFNSRLYNKLLELSSANLTLYQFVDNIFELMAKSDIIITKAGPTTIIEAAQMRKPMIITSWVGLHERENIKFVLKNSLGLYCPDIDKIPDGISEIYKNYSKFINKNPKWNGLDNIAKFLSAQTL